ncbi:hypothetical protein RND81_02G073100 [Saponaria officinalis]|uniref:Uncharacterized protein n=1 Tax=Saponaria officinalis TaxID=3572 RepID=A0AAW1MRZ8_SAPOF
MALFYSDAFLYKQPLTTTHSTTISLPSRPKFRLQRQGRGLPTVQLGRKKPRPGRARARGRGFFLSRFFKRARCKWLQLRYSCILRRLKKYYKSLIKDIVEGNSRVEGCHQQGVLRDSNILNGPNVGLSFSNLHGGSTLRTPNNKSIII